MRWPWGRRARELEARQREAQRRQQEADNAVATASQALHEVQSQWPEVNERAAALAKIRRENHLAELVRRNLRGRHA